MPQALRLRRLFLALLSMSLLAASLAPGSASAFRRIHHPDPIGAFAKYRHARPVHAAGFISSLQATWPCTATTSDRPPIISSNAPQVKLIYAFPTGTDNFATVKDMMEKDGKAVEDLVGSQAGTSSKTIRFDRGALDGANGLCDQHPSQYLDIQKVALDHTAGTYNPGSTFTTLTNELKSKLPHPAAGARVNYVVYAEMIQATGASGEADIPLDDSHDQLNSANQGRDGDGRFFAVVYGNPADQTNFIGVANATNADSLREATFLHELTHNLGAVQMSAPHTSNHGHCLDENDIMCYDDDGAGPNTTTLVCNVGTPGFFTEAYDCNNDDYRNSNPTAGSYLATHWNTFDNVFLCLQSSCELSLTPPPAVTFGTTHTNGRLTLTATGGASIAHYEWDIDGNGVYDVDSGSTSQITPDFTFITPRTVRVRASKADGTYAFDSSLLTPVVPTASFTATGNVVGQTLQLDGTATQDPDGFVTKFLWDLDGDGTYETDTGLTRTASTLLTAAGPRSVGLEVDFPLGFSQARANFTVVNPAPVTTITPPTTTPSVAGPSLSAGKVKLGALIKSGMPFTITCHAACTVKLALNIDSKLAKKLKIKPSKVVTIGRLNGGFAAGTVKRTLKLSASAKKGLKNVKSLKASLTGSVNQPPGSALKVSKALTFKR